MNGRCWECNQYLLMRNQIVGYMCLDSKKVISRIVQIRTDSINLITMGLVLGHRNFFETEIGFDAKNILKSGFWSKNPGTDDLYCSLLSYDSLILFVVSFHFFNQNLVRSRITFSNSRIKQKSTLEVSIIIFDKPSRCLVWFAKILVRRW